jgi:hypothetical protein
MEWDVEDGVRQGCPLGPILFVVVLGFLLKIVRDRYPSMLDQEYADDLTIINNSLEALEEILEFIVAEGPALGLVVNVQKTDYIKVVDGAVTQSAKLLGSYIGEQWNVTVKRNIDKSRNMFLMCYHKLWKTEIGLRVKLRVYMSVCIPVLLYGLESLPLTEARLRPLDSCVYRCLRSIIGYEYDAHVSYEMIEERCAEAGVVLVWPSIMLSKRRSSDYWHFFRHHTEFALLGVDGKYKNRALTLDQVVCREEQINLKDLNLLARFPERTRDASSIRELVRDIKNEEELLQRELQEKEYERARIWFEEQRKSVSQKLQTLEHYKRASYLLGIGADYEKEVKLLKNQLI